MKIIIKLSILLITLLSFSCQSVDHGYFMMDENEIIEDTDVSTLTISPSLQINYIDKEKISWFSYGFQKEIIRLTPEVHSLSIKYDNGSVYTVKDTVVVGKFESGKSYTLTSDIIGGRVNYDITDNETGETILMNFNDLSGKGISQISQYIKYVLNPTMEKSNKSVTLENENYIVIFNPDMTYSLTNKTDNNTTVGRNGFMTDFTMKEGTTYLLQVDPATMSKDQFLNDSNYTEISEIALKIVSCNEKSVTYEYIRPIALAGTQINFNIK